MLAHSLRQLVHRGGRAEAAGHRASTVGTQKAVMASAQLASFSPGPVDCPTSRVRLSTSAITVCVDDPSQLCSKDNLI